MRAEGQRWEDFKKACIDSFRAKGMLEEEYKRNNLRNRRSRWVGYQIYLEEKPRYSSKRQIKGEVEKCKNKTRRRWEVPPIHHYRGANT